MGVALTSIGVGLAGAAPSGTSQPELAHFKVGYPGSTSRSGTTVLSDGNTVVASLDTGGTSISVCELVPRSRSCTAHSSLAAPGGADIFGVAAVTTGGTNVTILTELSGSFDAVNFPIIAYNSSNDGQSFSGPVVVSSNLYGVDSATVVNGNILVAVMNPHDGLDVQQINRFGSPVASTYANVSGSDDSTAMITNDNGSALVAAVNLNASPAVTDVFEATSNYDNAGSYSQVGAFAHRSLEGLSGDAVLLSTGSLTKIGKISFFNGSSFGSQFAVPDSPAGDDGYASLQQTGDESGRSSTGTYNVFFEGRRNGYDLIEESTTNGITWTHQTFFDSAVVSGNPVPALNPTGAGIVFESGTTGAASQRIQPILFPVQVTISLVQSTISSGSSTTLNGQMDIGVQGTTVTLQMKSGSSWSDVTTTTEMIPGQFSFTVNKAHKYRAVVDWVPGYLRYGYSNTVSLKVS